MDPAVITQEALIAILLSSRKRAELLSALKTETGFDLPLTNRYHEMAKRCEATPGQLVRVAEILLRIRPQNDRLIDPLVYHPQMPEKVLFDLLHLGRCITSLEHRSGPRALLEKLAEMNHSSEAITTLALNYYGAPDASLKDFGEFVKKHRDDPMLRWNLKNSATLPENKQALALSIIYG